MIVLTLLLAASAHAASRLSPCVGKAKGALVEPATLDALVDCQGKALDAAKTRFSQKHGGRAPDEELIESWQDAQRAEVQDYVSRHADRAGLTEKKPVAGSKPAASLSEEDQLKADLWNKSDDGKKGVTPEMADEITKYLNEKQGGVSPEMKDLLESLQKDGANLSDESMLKLKKAARAADGAGLDLGVAPQMKKDLLDPVTDPKPGDRPGAN